MAFALDKPTAVHITNANPRREMHGEEKVRAIDLAFTLKGENTLLDLIQEGLREHHFYNKAAQEHQGTLPDVLIPLPNLKHPNLPTSYHYQKGVKLRGYRFVWDYGLDGDHVDFQDAVLANLQYELYEGGTVEVKGTIQYNGEELQDNILYGELSGLASEGEIHIKLIPPAVLQIAKKGYRAGQPDTQPAPEKNPDQGELNVSGQETPEDALAKSALESQAVWIQGQPEDTFESVNDLLGCMVESGDLDVHQELTIETASGTSHVIRITDIDADNSKAFFNLVPIKALEDVPA